MTYLLVAIVCIGVTIQKWESDKIINSGSDDPNKIINSGSDDIIFGEQASET